MPLHGYKLCVPPCAAARRLPTSAVQKTSKLGAGSASNAIHMGHTEVSESSVIALCPAPGPETCKNVKNVWHFDLEKKDGNAVSSLCCSVPLGIHRRAAQVSPLGIFEIDLR